jgi:hypothetical protein
MLPVYLEKPSEQRPGAGFRLNLTREGWLQPWARLRDNELDEKKRLAETPPFLVLNQVREPKPGASVIATVSDGSGKTFPALIVQRFGSGRTAALTIGDLWHWGFRDKEVRRDLDKAWRQMVRWLIADVPERIALAVEPKTADPDQAVLLQVRVRDEKFQPLDNASVGISVRPLSADGQFNQLPTNSAATSAEGIKLGDFIRLTAEPALAESGVYQAVYLPRQTGGYFAEAVVTNAVGAEVGRVQAGWSSEPAAEEFRSLKPNVALLEELARRTGGEMVRIDSLASFAANLPRKKVPVTESWSFPLWHQPLVFLFALACFVGEWGLRRWKGLA